MIPKRYEEILESIWTCAELNDNTFEGIKKRANTEIDEEIMVELEKGNFIARDKGIILLTSRGKEIATNIVRRHRLAERLLSDALKLPVAQTEKTACEAEHSLVPEVTDSICTLLGHPRQCPHGMPIPPGKCCEEAKEVVEATAIPLTKLKVGEKARIAYILPKLHSRLHKLISFGISPGVKIEFHQKNPTYVVRCGNVEVALEEDVANDIFIWKETS